MRRSMDSVAPLPPLSPAIGADIWQRLLARNPQDSALSPLYGPLVAAATAPDGCFVVGRIAQTLDGRIATEAGRSFWISGPAEIAHTHRLRALSDAVIVGAGTVLADDPQLTTRDCAGPSPVRVVIDPDRRLPAERRVFAGGPSTLLLCAEDAPGTARIGHAHVLPIRRVADGRSLDIPAILAALAARGLSRILVEGGGVTLSRFLVAGVLDRLHLAVAPMLLGSGIPAFRWPGAAHPGDGLPLDYTLHHLGPDLLFDIHLARTAPPMPPAPIAA